MANYDKRKLGALVGKIKSKAAGKAFERGDGWRGRIVWPLTAHHVAKRRQS